MDVTFPFKDIFSPEWNRRLEYRWHRLSEWRLRRIFAKRERQCVHYLYPENTLFHGNEWKRNHGIVLSCHQPAAYLQGMKQGGHEGFFRGLESADRVVLLASHFKADYETLCDRSRLVVIPHGVDANFFRPASAKPQQPLVITIGNWLRDYDFWASAVIKLGIEMPEVQFAVVATPQALGEARARAEAKLGGRIRFLQGLTDEQLRDLYQQAAVLFLPLKDAGANNALLEAMASGVPVVVTDLPASREYAEGCGVFFARDAIEECVSKLAEVLTDAKQWDALSQACHLRAVEHFAWEVIARRYASLYSEVLGER